LIKGRRVAPPFAGYCEVDRFTEIAWSGFGNLPTFRTA
jgi:hypothetical protein